MRPDNCPYAAQEGFRRWQSMAEMPITVAELPNFLAQISPQNAEKVGTMAENNLRGTATENALPRKKIHARQQQQSSDLKSIVFNLFTHCS